MSHDYTTEKQMQKICPYLCTSQINENKDVEIAHVNCLGPQCALWAQFDNFGMCSITAANEAVIHKEMASIAEKQGAKDE